MDKKNDIFDEIAGEYRLIHDRNLKLTGQDSAYYSEYKIKEIRSFLVEPLSFLDIGCGDGLSAFFVRKYFSEVNYIGIDVSEESINVARSRNLDNFHFLPYNGMEIPVSSHTVDCVFISCVLHHIAHSQYRDIFNECLRVMVPHGKLIIFEHNSMNPITRMIVKDCIFDRDAVLIGYRKLMRMLRMSGFRKLEVNFTLFLPRTGVFNKILFIERWLKKIPLGGQYYIVAQCDPTSL